MKLPSKQSKTCKPTTNKISNQPKLKQINNKQFKLTQQPNSKHIKLTRKQTKQTNQTIHTQNNRQGTQSTTVNKLSTKHPKHKKTTKKPTTNLKHKPKPIQYKQLTQSKHIKTQQTLIQHNHHFKLAIT